MFKVIGPNGVVKAYNGRVRRFATRREAEMYAGDMTAWSFKKYTVLED